MNMTNTQEISLTGFLNTEVGYYAMKRVLISEFSPESLLFLKDWYFFKQRIRRILTITDDEQSPYSDSSLYVSSLLKCLQTLLNPKITQNCRAMVIRFGKS